MIYLIVGENIQVVDSEIAQIVGAKEKINYDGSTLSGDRLIDIIRGSTLFFDDSVAIIRNLSEQKDVWQKFPDWAGPMGTEKTVVLVESSIDRRTKTYKDLSKIAKIISADYLSDREVGLAEKWTTDIAKTNKTDLSRNQIGQIIRSSMRPHGKPGRFIIDQAVIEKAIQSLSLLDKITDDDVDAVTPSSISDSVFDLLESAISRDLAKSQKMSSRLRASADGFMAVATVEKQWSQLVAVKLAGPSDSRLGIHPYLLGKIRGWSQQLSQADIVKFTRQLAELDMKLKTSSLSVWDALDGFIFALARR